jgi:radical SAM protein with 4Fe4S-binding SPASM domain
MSFKIGTRQLHDYVSRNTECDSPPIEWMVESTNRCNLRCPMCPRGSGKYPPEDMSYEFFQSLMRNYPDVECIWPQGFGEPLLHPKIFDFIRFAKLAGKTVSMSTNVSLLDEAGSAELIESKLDYLVLPVDGVQDRTYSSNRSPASLDSIEARIECLLKTKAALQSKIHVTVQMVLMRNNASEIGAFRTKWMRPGVNSIRVRDDLSGFAEVRVEGKRSLPGASRPCFFLWRGPLFVQARGTIIPCPYYLESEPFGDLRLQTLSEAWNSEQMQSLRAAHLNGDLSRYPVCAKCPRHQPHPILASLSFFVTTHHIRRVIPRLEDLQRRLGLKFVE